ncbi:MAG: hypothetical protein NTV94_15620, partial [Planctomycetota bacterium]|nr:hypothetical protein [Planctomycetota bacterium]
ALRPLLHSVVPSLLALTWEHPWMAHLAGGLGHGAVCLILYRLALALGAPARAAAAAALLFMCWGVHHEAWLWISAFGSLATTLLYGLMTLATVRFARSAETANGWFAGWWWVGCIMLLAASSLCFQEQASGAFPALALLYLALRAGCEPLGRSLVRAGVAGAAPGLLVPMYLAIVGTHAQPGIGVSAQTTVGLAQLPMRVAELLEGVAKKLSLNRFGGGALSLGLDAFASSWWMALAALALAAIAAASLVAAWMRANDLRWDRPSAHAPSTVPSLLFAAAAMTGSCLAPAWVSGYVMNSRVSYLPIWCFCLLVAGVLGAMLRQTSLERLLRSRAMNTRTSVVVTGLVGTLVLLCGATITAGAAERMRRVVAADDRNGKELVSQVPSPTAGTFILPVSLRPDLFDTGSATFDTTIRSVWERLWSMPTFVQFQYRRTDVFSLGQPVGLPAVLGADREGVSVPWAWYMPWRSGDSGIARIPWDAVVPITFGDDGSLRVVSKLSVRQGGRVTLEIRPSQVGRLVEQGRLPDLEAVLELP